MQTSLENQMTTGEGILSWPPQDAGSLAEWRLRANAIPRVALLAAALNNGSAARMFEAAFQQKSVGYLKTKNNGNFVKGFRVLFPSLKPHPSQREINAAIEALSSEPH